MASLSPPSQSVSLVSCGGVERESASLGSITLYGRCYQVRSVISVCLICLLPKGRRGLIEMAIVVLLSPPPHPSLL